MENSKTAFRDYLQLEKKYSPHTVNAYLNDLISFETYIKTEFDSEDLLNVNYSLIRSWIVTLVDAQISNTSVNRKISSLKSYYKFLLKTKQIAISPLLKHKSLKTPKTLQIPFSEKELDEVLNSINYPFLSRNKRVARMSNWKHLHFFFPRSCKKRFLHSCFQN